MSKALLNKDAGLGEYAKAADNAAREAVALDNLLLTKARVDKDDVDVKNAKKSTETALKTLANARNGVDFLFQARTVTFWALASALGVVASAALKLYFLYTVGIGPSPRWIQVLATGLIIGAGTKPLHDLISTISDKREAKAPASAVATVSAGG